MNLSKLILKIAGWTVDITVPDYSKCIICVAPHTSNWDFILGKLAYASVRRKAGFLMKESWFFFPLGMIFKAMGGIPVPRKKGASLVDTLTKKIHNSTRLAIAITPEGTRSANANWRHGFLHIARLADVPIVLGAIDFKTKSIIIKEIFIPTDDADADLKVIKKYYSQFTGKYSEKFITD